MDNAPASSCVADGDRPRALRVLIAEDDLLIAFDLEALVIECGHVVVGIAACAAEAVRLAREQRADVALMDVRLARGTSGVDAATELYRVDRMRSIFVSASLDAALRLALAAIEPVALLDKPVSPARLTDALAAAAAL